MLIVCHGQTTPDVMRDAIISMREPRKVVTMDFVWWEVAADMNLPRYFFKSQQPLMQFILGKPATVLSCQEDSFTASLKGTGLNVWPVMEV